MSWNLCKQPECEAYTARPDGDYCESCRRLNAKLSENETKSLQKRAQLLSKPRQVRKTISKNPKDWKNTFLCSDGTRVTQAEINALRSEAYLLYDWQDPIEPRKRVTCEGCGMLATCHAHIIPQARCKQIGKTELIWNPSNFFNSDHRCNSAIENPKGKGWKRLKNVNYCLSFIKEHDQELFSKFSAD